MGRIWGGGGGVLARVKVENKKEEIIKKKSRLAGKRIYIHHNLTQREREMQRELAEVTRTDRSNGRKVKMVYQKIWIEGECIRCGKSEARRSRTQIFDETQGTEEKRKWKWGSSEAEEN
ncbi:hypothetical protein WN48_02213 [Eufriesea mexicana]|uniref:Uncharacterized protein n=1 Tax=Eufriesea mexicana TaxID=516756 RepID=A0A310SDD9_9HYME|nr:hypothetical protein WN48_02213 [Eufriesea mexicana]